MIPLLSLAAAALLNGPPAFGDVIPSFTLQGQGRAVAYRPLRVTVLTFCAFWCDTWKDQLPRVAESKRTLTGLPVDFMTISVDGRWSERGRSAAVGQALSDSGGTLTERLGIDRVPYTLLVDERGVVRWVAYGVLRSDELTRQVRKTLQGTVAGGTVYLTFDDFPADKLNDELLDVLRAKRVPATFFCICSKLASHKAETSRAVREGHDLEVHAWSHEEQATDWNRCAAALNVFGVQPIWLRRSGTEDIESRGGAKLSIRKVDPYDFKRPSVGELTRRILYSVRDQNVIQLHAGVQPTIQALPGIIDNLRSRGYRFELLPSKAH